MKQSIASMSNKTNPPSIQTASQAFQSSETGHRALHSGVLVKAAFWAFKASSRSRKWPACRRIRSIAVVALAFDTHPNSWNVQVAFNQPSASPSNWISRWSKAGIAEALTPLKNSADKSRDNRLCTWRMTITFVHYAFCFLRARTWVDTQQIKSISLFKRDIHKWWVGQNDKSRI